MKHKTVFLSCKIFEAVTQKKIVAESIDTVIFLDFGLHATPKKLASTLQETLDHLTEPSLVILGYGLCGNGLGNIKAGCHTLIIPKAHDCITILMGSRQRYEKEFNSHPNTYYLTKGWLEVGTDPLSQYEDFILKYGLETADWMMDQLFQHYRRLVFLAYSAQDLENYHSRAIKVAKFCQRWAMVYEEMLGEDGLINKLLSTAMQPERIDDEFIVIQPGGTLTMDHFMEASHV
jgi:hypothetical protein